MLLKQLSSIRLINEPDQQGLLTAVCESDRIAERFTELLALVGWNTKTVVHSDDAVIVKFHKNKETGCTDVSSA